VGDIDKSILSTIDEAYAIFIMMDINMWTSALSFAIVRLLSLIDIINRL